MKNIPITEGDRAGDLVVAELLRGTPVADIARRAGVQEERIRDTLKQLVRHLTEHYIHDLTRDPWGMPGLLTDDVTGLWTRRYGQLRAQNALLVAERYSEPLSLVFLDIDGLKTINDRFGHAAGDRCLRLAANHWRANMRRSDFLCRWGGDEFLMLLPRTTHAAARLLVQRMEKRSPLDFTFSAGIAQWQPGDTLDELIQRADSAMFKEKHSRRFPAQ